MKQLLFVLFVLLCASPSWAAVAFDGVTTATASSASSISAVRAVGGGCTNSSLYADFVWYDASAIGITSVATTAGAMTQIGTVTDISGTETLRTYRRVGTSGSQTVTVTFSGGNATAATLVATSYCGVDQVTPEGGTVVTNTGAGAAPSIVATSATGQLVKDSIFIYTPPLTLTVDGSQTQRANLNDGANFFVTGVSEKAGAASVTMSWTLDGSYNWQMIAVPISPAAAVTGGNVFRRRAF